MKILCNICKIMHEIELQNLSGGDTPEPLFGTGTQNRALPCKILAARLSWFKVLGPMMLKLG